MKTHREWTRRALAVAALAVIFGLGIAANEAWHRRSDEDRAETRYLSPASKDVRGRAKAAARDSVRSHGCGSSAEERVAAEKILEAHRQVVVTNGTATMDAMFAAAKDRTRLERIARGEFASEDEKNEFTPEEREILEVAAEAISDHDLETAIDVATEALKSKQPEVRRRAVETLTEFGEAGIPELADFLSDADSDVAQLAADRFELAVQEIENEEEMVAVAKLGMLSIDDPDELSAMAGTLLMANDALTVVSALADVIEGGTENQSAAAKDAYQSQTGEDWQSVEAADRWLQENYEPPEPDAGD